MHGDGHAVTGALAGVGVAAALGLDPGQGLLAIALTSAGATGITSPDVDLWVKGSGILAHRRVTHWPAAVLGVATAGALILSLHAPDALWAWLAYTAGWVTHLAGDWAFGRRVYGTDGPGIPFRGPASGYHGLGLFRSGGRIERAFTWCVAAPALVAAVTVWTGLPLPALAGLAAVAAVTVSGSTRRRSRRRR